MEIKRRFEKLVVTKRRFVVRQSPPAKQTTCAECGEPMLEIAQAAVLLGIKQRRIFRIIEVGAAHFTENESGALMICLPSLSAVLDDGTQKNQNFAKPFFIRWLLIRDEKEQQDEKSVIDIEHIQSGDSQRVSSLEEANLWMREIDADGAEKRTESER